MSYLVLARKWRPMRFEEVVAQNHITTTLINAIKQNRLASAYLFAGPRGVGKTTTARILAKAINCDQGPTPEPCNECTSCKEITESRSLDVFEIDGASNRGIDEVRNLRENLRYAPTQGKYKIYIIDEVHMLTTEAFNALLKTLEEPPPKVLFIFATTEPHKVPATILSRCQRYDFRRIPLNEIVQQLQLICKSEHIKIDEQTLYLIAKKSEGSLRDSQSLLDQLISYCGQEINAQEVTELLGIINQELYFECTDTIINKNIAGGLALVDKVFTQGYDMGEFLNGLAEHFRNILVVKATGNTDLLEGLDSYNSRYQEIARNFSETDLLRLIQMASESSTHVRRSSNPKLLLEMLLVKMIKMDRSVALEDLLSKLNYMKQTSTSLQPPLDKEPVKKKAPELVPIKQVSVAIKDQEEIYGEATDTPGAQKLKEVDKQTLHIIQEQWQDIVAGVKNIRIHLGSFLNEGYPTEIKNDYLMISFGKDNGFHINTLNQNRRLIQKVIGEITGYAVKIKCVKNESEAFNQFLQNYKSALQSSKTKETIDEESIVQIPIVKKIIEVFDGEIINQ